MKGDVVWVDLEEIEQQKVNALRKDLLKNVDEQIAVYNNKLSPLANLKNKINKANDKELQQYRYSGNTRGIVQFFNSWLGERIKMHEKSGKYFF